MHLIEYFYELTDLDINSFDLEINELPVEVIHNKMISISNVLID